MPAPYFRLRQICLVSESLGRVERAFEEVLGLRVGYRDPNVAKYGLRNVLFPVGTEFIEVVAPMQSGTAAGRFLERSGGRGAYMAIFDCSDPDERATRANALGVPTAHEIDHPGYRGIQLHPRHCRAAMIEFDRSEGASDPMACYAPAGGTGWTGAIRTGTTVRMTHIVAQGPDAAGLAAHWSGLLGLPLKDERIETDMLAIVFEPGADGDREAVTRIGLDVVDPQSVLASARAAGLPVHAQSIDLAGVRFDLRRSSPAAT